MTLTAPGPLRDTFRSFGIRNFRLFFIGQLISQTGTWMTMVAQTLLVLELAGSGVLLGLLAAAQFGPVLLLGAWAGTIADRVDKRRMLFVTQVSAMMQSLILGLIVLAGHASVAVILVLAVVQGIITAFDNPTRRSFVVEMVPADNVSNAVSLNSTLMTSSRVVGPALAGLLIGLVGYAWLFLADALSYLAVLTGLAMMRSKELYSTAPAIRARGQIREGLRYVASTPHQFIPLVMMAVVGTFAFNFSVTAPLLVVGPLGGTEQAYTLLLSTMSLGAVVGAIATARRREVPFDHLVWASVSFGVSLFLLALSPSLGFAYPAAVLVGVTSIAFMTTATAMVQLTAAPQFRGRVLALQAMVFLGTTPLGGPLVGLVADYAGPRSAILLGMVACAGAAWWGRRTWRGRELLSAATPPPILID